MKTLSVCAVILFSIFTTTNSFAQKSVIKETFKVWGNCGMCKKTIERSAKSAGATTATWNEETKQLKVSYAAAKTTGLKIQSAIAKSGYDTPAFTADQKAYEGLNSCCQYERKDRTAFSGKTKTCCNGDLEVCKEMDNCKSKDCCKM